MLFYFDEKGNTPVVEDKMPGYMDEAEKIANR